MDLLRIVLVCTLFLLPRAASAQAELRVSATVLPPQGIEVGGDGVEVGADRTGAALEVPLANRGDAPYLVQWTDASGREVGPATRLHARERTRIRIPPVREGETASVTCVVWPMT